MDTVSLQRLSQVHPLLQAKIRAMDEALTAQGIVIRVTQGLRTKDDQDHLYAKGRTDASLKAQGFPDSLIAEINDDDPGHDTEAKVTNAPGGYSMHNFGLAVDCIPGIRGKNPWEPNFDAKHPDFAAMIAAGEAQGLVSGSTWKSIPDKPHFQLAGLPITPNQAMRDLLAQRGMQAVWNTIPPEVV